MSRDRAATFADRLPPVVPKVEEDIEGLSDELVEILAFDEQGSGH